MRGGGSRDVRELIGGDKAKVVESWRRGLTSSGGSDMEEGRGSSLCREGEEGRQIRGDRGGGGQQENWRGAGVVKRGRGRRGDRYGEKWRLE